MPRSAHRVLCVDSSPRRLHELRDTLQRAGFEIWTARGAGDAVCLAAGLNFDVLVVDQASSLARPEVWDCLSQAQPGLPILVHSGASKGPDLCRHLRLVSSSAQPQNPEVVLALLLLLLGDGNGSQFKLQESVAA